MTKFSTPDRIQMESYMERQLTNLHDSGSQTNIWQKMITFFIGLAFIVLLPYLHIGVFYGIWTAGKPEVDRAKCSCDCFDTVFRGQYEWPPSAYKHLYFNATRNTLQMWIVVVLGILATYEAIRYVVPLIASRRLRYPMFIALISSIYPHYYGWWNIINYFNEDFFAQFGHQLFFSVTELLSTIMVLHLCNTANKVLPWKLLVVMVINLMHIIISSLDQFVGNIFYHEAKGFEAVRDIALMAPDIFNVLLPFFELQTLSQKKRIPIHALFYKEEIMLSGLVLVLFSLLGKNL